MKKYLYLILILTGSFFSPFLQAQGLDEDMKKMYRYYYEKEALSLTVSVDVYSTSDEKMFSQKADLRKKGELFFYKIDDSEMLITETNVVLLNHRNKNILRRKIDEKEREALQKSYFSWKLDSTLLKYDSIQYVQVSDTEKKYTIYTTGNLVEKVDLWMNIKTGAFSKLIYYYPKRKGSKLKKAEMVFHENTDKALTADNLFSEKKYIVWDGAKYTTTPAFNHYDLKIVNQ